MYAVVRIRGSVGLDKKIKDTLSMLRLERVNHCVLIDKTPHMEGMVKKVRSYITWGEVDSKILEKLVEKRGRLPGNKKLEPKKAKEVARSIEKDKKVKEIKPVFRLSPPSRGFKAIRKDYPRGALGYRGEKINDLLKRMM
ncbi:MAG: 50S ribosomal protein L30 [Candidatus Aenigmatarchaeota archaeon]